MAPERTTEEGCDLEYATRNSQADLVTGNSQASLFEDARSDIDELLLRGLDQILSKVSDDASAATLSPTEMESSKKIRKKYGLEEFCGTDNDSICLSRVSATSSGRDYGYEVSIIYSSAQLIIRKFLDELVSGGTVENEHPLLEPYLAMVEIMLHHGWRRDSGLFAKGRGTLWELIRRVGRRGGASATAMENVRHFSSLKNSSARLRAWIRLAMIGKTLATDLTFLIDNEGHLITECYEEWSCIRSDVFQPILALISTLDAIDFNLFVKEEDIPKNEFINEWMGLFANDQINFDRLNPPVYISIGLLRINSMRSSSILSQGRPATPEDDILLHRLALLNDENSRLRRSLVAQINQRAYFQEEYSRSQKKCAAALHELHQMTEERNQFRGRAKELSSLVEAHEQSNVALQRQLADAYADDTNDREQGRRMRMTINKLSDELEQERALCKESHKELECQKEAMSKQVEQYQQTIAELQGRFAESEEAWLDRTKVLQEQLKVANGLKDEYKRRLKSASPDPQ